MSQNPSNENINSVRSINDGLDVIYKNHALNNSEIIIDKVSENILSMGINLEQVRKNFIAKEASDGKQK